MPANTIRLHRVLRAPPERVYRAYIKAVGMLDTLRSCDAFLAMPLRKNQL